MELAEWWERGLGTQWCQRGGKVLGYLLGQSHHPLLFLFHIKQHGYTPGKKSRLLFATNNLPNPQSPPKSLRQLFPSAEHWVIFKRKLEITGCETWRTKY